MFYGVPKLVEEIGELGCELGKVMAFPPSPIIANVHPDGKGDLRQRILDEMADVLAAISYVSDWNFTEAEHEAMIARAEAKHKQFMEWGMAGISTIPPVATSLKGKS